MTVLLKNQTGVCPYLDNRIWTTEMFYDFFTNSKKYQDLLDKGFRRTGYIFYRNACLECNQCQSLRVNSKNFKLSDTQKETWNKNSDIKVKIIEKLDYSNEVFQLYCRYVFERHGQTRPTKEEFKQLYCSKLSFTKLIKYYLETKLVAASWLDVLPKGTSSVYSIFDPSLSKRRLGIYTIIWEIKYTASMRLPWYYLGYWVKNGRKLDYKNQFAPHQLLIDNKWKNITL